MIKPTPSEESNPTENLNLVMYFEQQYLLIKGSRALLIDYCKSISQKDFVMANNAFGIASIRDLLVHIANCYRTWLGRSLKKEIDLISCDQIRSITDVSNLFEKVDKQMQQFIDFVEKERPKTIVVLRNGEVLRLSPLHLFSHVTTHEFHHKGQILSLSRHLGYTPVDTDIIQ